MNWLLVEPEPRLAEEDRPVRVTVHPPRDVGEEGRRDHDADRRDDDVHRALGDVGGAADTGRRQREDREALQRVDGHVRAVEVEQARHDIDAHVVVRQLARGRQRRLGRVARERDDHALDTELLDDLQQLLRPAEHVEPVEAGRLRLRRIVDEADELDAVLRVVHDLAREPLADVAGSDDDRPLRVRRAAPEPRPGAHAAEGDEHDRQDPRCELGRGIERRVEPDGEASVEQQRSDGDELQDADEVVRRRVVGALGVGPVEVVQRRDRDPRGKAREQQAELERRGRVADRSEHEQRHEERAGNREQIGGDERAPDERPSADEKAVRVERAAVRQGVLACSPLQKIRF